MVKIKTLATALFVLLPICAHTQEPAVPGRPNIVLVMTDDQGWGDTSYNGHPVLKTPNLDAMVAAGLRMDRFYAAAPVCTPTRASVLTGRHPLRYGITGVHTPLRREEVTIAQLLQEVGYATGHFGKWHLNGVKGPGLPVLANDPFHPGLFGFEKWCSSSNFVDIDDGLGCNGIPESYLGDSSDAIMTKALAFIRNSVAEHRPFFAVVWYGSPHSPHQALPEDKAAYAGLPEEQQNFFGELAAVDRTVGELRATLRELNVADNTLVWFCSDNGGLTVSEHSRGGLRGHKNTVWEGGVRVPGIIEWPSMIATPIRTDFPASTLDIFPTITEMLGLTSSRRIEPIDGQSLLPLMRGTLQTRKMPITFSRGNSAIIDNDLKLVEVGNGPNTTWELYDLVADPNETKNLAAEKPQEVTRLLNQFEEWRASAARSQAGKDYPEEKLTYPRINGREPSPEETNWRENAKTSPDAGSGGL